MSRDFKPIELYVADRCVKTKDECGLRDMKITWVSPDGKETEVPEKTSKIVFPELSFLFEPFEELYKSNLENEAALAVFRNVENIIKELEYEATETSDSEFMRSVEQKKKYPFSDTVSRWFYGKLDDSFYYNERNDELFKEFLLDEIEKEHSGASTVKRNRRVGNYEYRKRT
jgi:hypothetical protein